MKNRARCSSQAIFFLILIIISENNLLAQNQNIWVWGAQAGLNFNFANPVTSIFKNIAPGYGTPYSSETGSSICDNNGQLLFYTEGSVVYDRQQKIMPNGDKIVPIATTSMSPTSSSSQGVVIVPYPGKFNQYYIFSMSCSESRAMGQLYYSVVDMTLNGGFGDVVTNQKGVLIDTGYSEQMAAVYYSCGNYWLFAIERAQGVVKAYPITSSGIGSPTSTALLAASVRTDGAGGIIAFSNNGKKVAIMFGGLIGMSLFDFDGATGQLNNQEVIDQTLIVGGGGLCFSPDDTRLYLNADHNTIYQYDLNAGNANAILASRAAVFTSSSGVFSSHLKLAPNGKIYFSGVPGSISGTSYLSSINQPNALGAACQVETNALTLAAGSYHYVGLPTNVPQPKYDTVTSTQQISSCNFRQMLMPEDTNGHAYQWNDGITSKVRNVSTSGIYWVRYNTLCGIQIDTFHVNIVPPVTTQIKQVICGNESYPFGGESLNKTGVYRDTVKTENGCDSIVVLDLIVVPSQMVNVAYDLPEMLCLEDTVLFQGSGSQSYAWYLDNKLVSDVNPMFFSFKNKENNIMLIGSASIGGTDITCLDTAQVDINAVSCCDLFVPNAFTPNADGQNDVLEVKTVHRIKSFMFEVYNRWGKLLFSTNQISKGWDGTFSGSLVETGVYYYYMRYECDNGKIKERKGDITVVR